MYRFSEWVFWWAQFFQRVDTREALSLWFERPGRKIQKLLRMETSKIRCLQSSQIREDYKPFACTAATVDCAEARSTISCQDCAEKNAAVQQRILRCGQFLWEWKWSLYFDVFINDSLPFVMSLSRSFTAPLEQRMRWNRQMGSESDSERKQGEISCHRHALACRVCARQIFVK